MKNGVDIVENGNVGNGTDGNDNDSDGNDNDSDGNDNDNDEKDNDGDDTDGNDTDGNNDVPLPSSSTTTKTSKTSALIKPADCRNLLDNGYTNARGAGGKDASNLNPNMNKIHARYIRKLSPSFWLSAHLPEVDDTLHSNVLRPVLVKFAEGTLEVYNQTAMTTIVKDILNSTEQQHDDGNVVIDIGAREGWYSLVARSHSIPVYSFDPILANVFRLCESLWLNRWIDNGPVLAAYQAAVGDSTAQQAGLYKQGPVEAGTTATTTSTDQETQDRIETTWIALDDFAVSEGWLSGDGTTTTTASSVHVTILKIHVDGHVGVLKSAVKLLQSGLVDNILMTVATTTTDPEKDWLSLLTDHGYTLHQWGGWEGPTNNESFPTSKLTEQESLPLTLWFKRLKE